MYFASYLEENDNFKCYTVPIEVGLTSPSFVINIATITYFSTYKQTKYVI